MKLPAIKKAVEYSIEQLKEAEEALYNEQPLKIEIEGDDDGEKLTHILAAIFVKTDMAENNHDLNTSVRNYAVRVRNSIN
jgi:hypothetical protein